GSRRSSLCSAAGPIRAYESIIQATLPGSGWARFPAAVQIRRDIVSSVKESSQALGGELLSAMSLVRRSARRAVRQVSETEPLPLAQGELLRLAASRPGITVADAAQELRLAPNTV